MMCFRAKITSLAGTITLALISSVSQVDAATEATCSQAAVPLWAPNNNPGAGLPNPFVHIVDYDPVNNNILVRGPLAFGAKNFNSSSDLIEAIEKSDAQDGNSALAASNFSTSKSYNIIDVSLIGYKGASDKDAGLVAAESSWFSSTQQVIPGHGGRYPYIIQSNPIQTCVNSDSNLSSLTMVYWPVFNIAVANKPAVGAAWNPSTNYVIGPKKVAGKLGPYWYAGLVPALYDMVHNKTSNLNGLLALTPSKSSSFPTANIKNTIIYVHCDSGFNRTGALVTSYLQWFGSNVGSSYSVNGKAPDLSCTDPKNKNPVPCSTSFFMNLSASEKNQENVVTAPAPDGGFTWSAVSAAHVPAPPANSNDPSSYPLGIGQYTSAAYCNYVVSIQNNISKDRFSHPLYSQCNTSSGY